VDLHTVFRLVLAISGSVFGFLAFNILKEIYESGDQVMASFRLKPDKAIGDFKILLAGEIFMLAGFFTYFLGGFLEVQELLSVGRLMAILFSVSPIVTFYRWWRRF